MTIAEWARKEVENYKKVNGGCDYASDCADSALRAFLELLKDGHSGMSITVTEHILRKLIGRKPLTDIDDTEDVWNEVGAYNEDEDREGITNYQCKRMSSLFKKVDKDGKVIQYSDCDRAVGVSIHNPSATYGSGGVSRIVNEYFPVTMPYRPPVRPYKVYTEDFLYDPKNGDFDTVAFFYILTPEGEKVEVNKFYHYPARGVKEEITKQIYDKMKERGDAEK